MADDGEESGHHADVNGRRAVKQGKGRETLPKQHGQRPLERIGCKDRIAPLFPQHAQRVRGPDVAAARRPQIHPANPARDEPARK